VSRGLGAALFQQFHGAGDRILALGRRFTEAQYAAERAEPQRIRLRQTDLAHTASIPGAAELGSFVHDATDVVVIHNAGVVEPIGAVGALPPEQIENAVAVNLTAPMVLTNAIMGSGVIRNSGRDGAAANRPLTILFISSGAAQRVVGGWSVYSTTKRAAETYFEALAAQHASDPRIRVRSVNPGVMDTDMQGTVRKYARGDVYFPDGAQFVGMHERGELPSATEVARRLIGEHLTAASHR
jgi:NAD(P)-dependent dehydrogenase (short-subunit alcohol dehydrogenase family)